MNERWRKAQVKLVERAQDRCVNRAVEQTGLVINKALDQMWDNYLQTGQYLQPTLNGLDQVGIAFYRHVIEEAFAHAEATKKQDKRPRRPKRMAGSTRKDGIPNTLRDLVQIFGNRKYWTDILKLSKRQQESLRREYLRKLKKRFKEVVPLVNGGALSPEEAKKQLQEEWQTTKARVTTVFRTETTNYFAKTQRAYYNKDNDIIGFLFDSVKDRARTKICRDRHGLVYRKGTKELTDNTPALHYNCRSHLIPLVNTPENRKLLDDPSRDPAKRQVAPLPHGWRK